MPTSPHKASVKRPRRERATLPTLSAGGAFKAPLQEMVYLRNTVLEPVPPTTSSYLIRDLGTKEPHCQSLKSHRISLDGYMDAEL